MRRLLTALIAAGLLVSTQAGAALAHGCHPPDRSLGGGKESYASVETLVGSPISGARGRIYQPNIIHVTPGSNTRTFIDLRPAYGSGYARIAAIATDDGKFDQWKVTYVDVGGNVSYEEWGWLDYTSAHDFRIEAAETFGSWRFDFYVANVHVATWNEWPDWEPRDIRVGGIQAANPDTQFMGWSPTYRPMLWTSVDYRQGIWWDFDYDDVTYYEAYSYMNVSVPAASTVRLWDGACD